MSVEGSAGGMQPEASGSDLLRQLDGLANPEEIMLVRVAYLAGFLRRQGKTERQALELIKKDPGVDGTPHETVTKIIHDVYHPPKFALRTLDDILNLPPPNWLIQDLFPKKGFILLYGEPGAAKSFIALDWALSIQAGRSWIGRQVEQGQVLYILSEMSLDIGNRVKAWMQRHCHDALPGPDGIRFICQAPQFILDGEVDELLKAIEDLPAKPSLLIIDTLARSTVGINENSTEHMGTVIHRIRQLIEATGAAVVVVHHANKTGDYERGSSALYGDLDVKLKAVKLRGGTVKLVCEKARGWAEFPPVYLELMGMDLGDGQSSCYLAEGAEPDAEPDAESKILEAMPNGCRDAESSPMTINRLAIAIGMHRDTVRVHLRHLQEKGLVRNNGTDKQHDWARVSGAPF